jgi:hypothetical protein
VVMAAVQATRHGRDPATCKQSASWHSLICSNASE